MKFKLNFDIHISRLYLLGQAENPKFTSSICMNLNMNHKTACSVTVVQSIIVEALGCDSVAV